MAYTQTKAVPSVPVMDLKVKIIMPKSKGFKCEMLHGRELLLKWIRPFIGTVCVFC